MIPCEITWTSIDDETTWVIETTLPAMPTPGMELRLHTIGTMDVIVTNVAMTESRAEIDLGGHPCPCGAGGADEMLKRGWRML